MVIRGLTASENPLSFLLLPGSGFIARIWFYFQDARVFVGSFLKFMPILSQL
jgi:hypothetical protein